MNAHVSVRGPHRLWLKVEDFLHLQGSETLANSAKTELIDGEILCTDAQFQQHGYVKDELAFRLRMAITAAKLDLRVTTEVSVAMPPYDMPAPDISVLKLPRGKGPIALASVVLLIEVSDTTRDIDLGRKAGLYARNGVPEYWVVDLERAEIVRHWQPAGQGYECRDSVRFGDGLAAVTVAGLGVETVNLG